MSHTHTPAPAPKPAVGSRACDRCRSIKIKCDAGKRDQPECSNCRRRGTECTFDAPVRKRGPRKRSPRVVSPSTDSRYTGLEPANEASEIETFGTPMTAATSPAVHPVSAHSPISVRVLAPSTSYTATQPSSPAAEDVLQHLIQALQASSGRTAESLTAACIDLYLRHLFPVTPLVHEASLRATWSQIFQYGYGRLSLTPEPQRPSPSSHPSHPSVDIFSPPSRHERGLTTLTAVCATVCALLPPNLFSEGQLVAGHFLKASQDLLHLYEDRDIERPEASSVIIRYFHCICTHAKGNQRVSWYIMGEAVRLALEMRLYDESSLAGLDPVEAQLRRAVFWQLHTGDRSAAILNERPYTLNHLTLDTPLTLRHLEAEDTHLLDTTRPCNSLPFVQCLNAGFNLSTRLFTCAASALLDLRLLDHFSTRPSGSADLVRGQSAAIVDSVLDFRKVLDDMPSWLERPWLAELAPDKEAATHQRDALWVQHVNLKLTFHCLRLILLQRASEAGHASLLGFSDDPRLLAMEKTDIARDMLACIQVAPFQALQINGEPCVEKIRQVGATLLQISQSGEQQVALRAKADFQLLLNVLTQLDSKVSAAMCRDVVMT